MSPHTGSSSIQISRKWLTHKLNRNTTLGAELNRDMTVGAELNRHRTLGAKCRCNIFVVFG